MQCPKCGADLNEHKLTCEGCAQPVSDHPTNESAAAEELKQKSHEDLLRLFVGKNHAYYMKNWEQKNSWNGAAFLVAPLWLGYRKMYGYVFFYVIAVFLLNYIMLLTLYSLWIPFLLSLGFATLTGFKGNDLYRRNAENHITRLQGNYNNAADLEHQVETTGGTSGTGAFLAFIVMFAYTMFCQEMLGF